MWCSGCAGPLAEAPEESIAPGAFDPLSFLLVFLLTLTRALALLILSELSSVRANRRVRVTLIVSWSSPALFPLFLALGFVLDAADADTVAVQWQM